MVSWYQLVSVGNEIEMNCSGYVGTVKRRNRNWGKVVGKEIQNIEDTVYRTQNTEGDKSVGQDPDPDPDRNFQKKRNDQLATWRTRAQGLLLDVCVPR